MLGLTVINISNREAIYQDTEQFFDGIQREKWTVRIKRENGVGSLSRT